MDEFDTARGTCRITDDVLVFERDRSASRKRWLKLQRQSKIQWQLAAMALIGVAFVLLVGPSVAAVVDLVFLFSIVLGSLFGIILVGAALMTGFTVLLFGFDWVGRVSDTEIPLDAVVDVTGVENGHSVRTATNSGTPSPEHPKISALLIRYDENGNTDTLKLGFQRGMGDEVNNAVDAFEQRGVAFERRTRTDIVRERFSFQSRKGDSDSA
ncbi:hypothetical protein AUR64_11750 [Haloprofundus marisrubri]|uniref:Uncharacterized protein n=1 Tax=Haloprofundus marisrubri TaxID=1514971 RepID=A0A0W1RAI1_9EURY|nr:hypothetical protein [Haloprofundus marisrubri]KTG10250.1 hypothetical protein AUR64_11750 [Haloprofundus marisrubri]